MKKILINHKLVFYLILTRIIILIIPSIFRLILTPPFTFSDFIESFVRWDAPHYIYLSKYWYTNVGDEANFLVFMPLYPFFIKLFSFIFTNYVFSAVVASLTFSVLGSLIFYKLVRLDYSKKTAITAFILINLFPTSYFFGLPYTEALFFFLVVSTFYLFRKKSWLAGGLIAALAFLTKQQGIFLVIVGFIEFLNSVKIKKIIPAKLISTLYIFMPSVFAVVLYLIINKLLFNNYFYFSYLLKTHWYKSFAWPWQGILASIDHLKGGINQSNLMIGFFETLGAFFLIILSIFAFIKLRLSYSVYIGLSVFLITSTGFLLSTPRYFLSIPIIFILMATMIKNKYILALILLIFIPLLIHFSVLYSLGQWAF